MQNQITIKDNNGQSISVNLISHFKIKSTGKEYVIYDKGENVNGGVKIYVEDVSINTIDQSVWESQIKPLMGNIIKGVDNLDIEYVSTGNELLITDINEPKIIVMTQEYINTLKSKYTENTKNVETNADALNNIFSDNNNQAAPVQSTQPEQTAPVQPQPESTVQITNPASLGVNFGEKSNEKEAFADQPVSLSQTPSVAPIETPTPPTIGTPTNVESPTVPEQPVVEPNNPVNTNVNTQNPTQTQTQESPFNVNSGPNMFDANVSTTPTVEPIVSEQPTASPVEQTAPTEDSLSLTTDIDLAMAKKEAEFYEEMAKLTRKKVELLEKTNSVANTIEKDDPLEQTAANLFDNNGALNDAQVLEFNPGAPTLNKVA